MVFALKSVHFLTAGVWFPAGRRVAGRQALYIHHHAGGVHEPALVSACATYSPLFAGCPCPLPLSLVMAVVEALSILGRFVWPTVTIVKRLDIHGWSMWSFMALVEGVNILC